MQSEWREDERGDLTMQIVLYALACIVLWLLVGLLVGLWLGPRVKEMSKRYPEVGTPRMRE